LKAQNEKDLIARLLSWVGLFGGGEPEFCRGGEIFFA